ncbi:MAG: PAS domain S-box protein [Ignavibacteria bacterium]|nr:PAS domain S-box protein [Ignavibacteria bacterium]
MTQIDSISTTDNSLILQLLDSIPDLIWSVSAKDNKILFVSPACKNIFGYSQDELIENPSLWNKLVVNEDLGKKKNAMRKVQTDNMKIDTIYRIRSKDGKLKWVKETIIPIIDERDDLIRIDGITRDISENIETEHKFKRLFNQSSNLMFLISIEDDEFFIENANLKLKELLNFTTQQLHGKNLLELTTNNFFNEIFHHCQEVVQSNKEIKIELTYECGLHQRHFAISLAPFYNYQNKITKIIGTGEEITELKKSEIRLRKLNEDKNRLLTIVSHDLKSPFNSMLNFIDLLTSGMIEDKNERMQYLTILQHSTEKQIELINNLLNWSKVESGLVDFSPKYIHLKQLIESVLTNFYTQLTEKKIQVEFDFEENQKFFFDENFARIIFSNLISNAIKFSFKGGKIIIGSSVEKNYIKIFLKDFGIGMTQRYMRDFLRGNYVDPIIGTAGEVGSGTGLKLCYELMTKNHGRLVIKSQERIGTEIDLFFPIPSKNIVYFKADDFDCSLKGLRKELLPKINLIHLEQFEELNELNIQPDAILIDEEYINGGNCIEIFSILKEFSKLIGVISNLNNLSQTKEQFEQVILKPITTKKVLDIL